MKHPFNKKSFWLTVAILVFVEAVIFCVALQWKYLFPSKKVSDLYARYDNVEGLEVSYIEDYKVNDTVFVDVILIKAKDSEAWDSLCKDFGIVLFSKYPKEYTADLTIENSFSQRVIIDTVVTKQEKTYNKTLVVFSHLNETMCIIQDIDDQQYNAFINKKYEEITI